MTLTKKAIIKAVATENGFSKDQAVKSVNSLIEIIKKTLESGDYVLITGFGTFRVITKKERRGRNPKTGEDLILEPRRVVRFKESDNLRKKLNG